MLATHPAVPDVAVVGLADERLGERCCAVVVPAPGAEPPTAADLGDHCRRAGLARYTAPEQVEVLAVLPRNAGGKLQRARIRAAVAPGE